MRACLLCRGLLVACCESLACSMCGFEFPLLSLVYFTDAEWADLEPMGVAAWV